jgi:hypothetical protein
MHRSIANIINDQIADVLPVIRKNPNKWQYVISGIQLSDNLSDATVTILKIP